MISISNIINKTPDFVFVLPLWIVTALAFRGVFVNDEDGDPPWDYLWDDRKNYVNNPRVHSLSFDNVRWAFADGVVLGVYEPISLVIKQALHTFIAFDPRMYRVVTLSVHAINVYLVFSAGRRFVASACDYDYYRRKLEFIINEKGKGRAVISSADGDPVVNNGRESDGVATIGSAAAASVKRSKKKKKDQASNDLAFNGGEKGESSSHDDGRTYVAESAESDLSYLRRHEASGIIGCMIGAGLFAVHPLQAQTIGWISCLPYCLSCFFSLLSFVAYVSHRSFLRDWRRWIRYRDGEDAAATRKTKGPWRMFHSSREKKRRSGSSSREEGTPDISETWLMTRDKALSLVCYVFATFCKAPAVILPVVFVIIDVYIYSSPLSVRRDGPSILREAMGTFGTVSPSPTGGEGSSSWALLLPNRLVTRFASIDLPILWHLTLSAIKAHAAYFAVTALSMIYLVGGNSRTILDPLNPFEKIEKATLALLWYVQKFFVPSGLVAAVEMQSFSFLEHWEVGLSLVLVPYGTLAVLANSTGGSVRRVVACAWGAFIALLLPSLGFIQHGRMFLAADRYMYIPLAMMCPLVGAIACSWVTIGRRVSADAAAEKFVHAGGPIATMKDSMVDRSYAGCFVDASLIFDRINRGKHKKNRGGGGGGEDRKGSASEGKRTTGSRLVPIGIFVCIMTALLGIAVWTSIATPSTLFYWRDTGLLWERNLQIVPDSENAHVNLSGYYASGGKDLERALIHAKAADALRPNHAKYRYNMGEIHRMMQKNAEARDIFLSILRDGSPRWLLPEIHYSLGLTYRALSDLDASKHHLDLALSLGKAQARSELNKVNEKILHDKKRNKG